MNDPERPRGALPAEVIWISPNEHTITFWEHTARHELVIPRCSECGAYRFPPAAFCWRCQRQEVEWVAHDRSGTVYSFTVIRHAVIPELREVLPLIPAVVELTGTDGCRMVASVVDCVPEDVQIGASVTIDWYDIRENTTVPVFRLVNG